MKDKYICDCCGGHIDPKTMTCEYCGTQYREDLVNEHVFRIETYRNPVQTLAVKQSYPREFFDMNAQEHARFAIESMARSFAEVIAPYMVVQKEDNFCDRTIDIKGMIKVVVPKEGINEWGK